MTNNTIKSAVIVDDYKVHYTFQRKKESNSLNAQGNFYKFAHQQKEIQKTSLTAAGFEPAPFRTGA